jgi:hypothetical protein
MEIVVGRGADPTVGLPVEVKSFAAWSLALRVGRGE